MDRLSSCYFCGAALDASLSEYPVVPKSLQPDADDQQTVVLCPTCRRKLATVIETVVTAVDDERRDTQRAPDQLEDQSDMMDESGMDPRPDPEDIADANESMDEDDGGLLGGDDDGQSSRSSSTDDKGLLGGDDETQTDRRGGEERTANDRQGREQSTATAESGSKSSTGGDSSNDGPTLTRLEYNKVMRLLQNRELPVDRAEIREVALNAYDIDAGQFEAVIDAAIEKDLIAEESDRDLDESTIDDYAERIERDVIDADE